MSAKNTLIAVFEEIYQQYNWAITEHHFKPKEDILVEDDEDDDDVYLIREGKATVIIGGGSEVILGEGDLIGEMSFLLSNKRTASIVAKESVHCWSVGISNMEKVFEVDPPLAARFYKALGGLLALRLVNSSKRATQNQVFQNNDDALISLMKIQASELQDHMQNFMRSLQNELKVDIQKTRKQIASIDIESSRPFDERRQVINQLSAQLSKTQEQRFQGVSHRIQGFFDEIQHMLMEILDLEKRNEVGLNAFAIFSRSILGEVPFLNLRDEQSLESVDMMLHIFHRGSTVEMWNAKDVVVDWIDRVLWEQPTLAAYRSRHDLTADIIIQNLSPEEGVPLDITLVYDAVGIVLTKILNTVARLGSTLNLVYSDPKTIYQIQYALTGRIGKVDLKSHRLSSLLSTILGDDPLLPNHVPLHSQRLIVISGLMNYLPDRYLVQLLSRAQQFVHPKGCILLSGVLPTEDQSLFNDFFRWPMIRRSEEELSRMMATLNLHVQIHTRNGGVVVQATQE